MKALGVQSENVCSACPNLSFWEVLCGHRTIADAGHMIFPPTELHAKYAMQQCERLHSKG